MVDLSNAIRPSQTAELPRADLLAIERTLLSNERTFLAYFRTAIVFASSGLAIRNIVFFSGIRYLAEVLLVLSGLVLLVGVLRSIRVHRRIVNYGKPPRDVEKPKSEN